MQFTPAQLRSAVGLSLETFRHWKRVLPPFASRKGRTACFSTGDLLAAAIIRRLADTCGIRIGRLTEVSGRIVELCNSVPWPALENRVLLVDPTSYSARLVEDRRNIQTSGLAIICALTPIMSELRDTLLRLKSSTAQVALPLPPTSVAQRHRRGGG